MATETKTSIVIDTTKGTSKKQRSITYVNPNATEAQMTAFVQQYGTLTTETVDEAAVVNRKTIPSTIEPYTILISDINTIDENRVSNDGRFWAYIVTQTGELTAPDGVTKDSWSFAFDSTLLTMFTEANPYEEGTYYFTIAGKENKYITTPLTVSVIIDGVTYTKTITVTNIFVND